MYSSFSSLATLAILPLLASAAPAPWDLSSFFSSSWSNNNAPSGSGSNGVKFTGKTHLVVVGGDAGLVYTPPVTYADVGDLVLFEFQKKNHSVTQSAFDTPCTPLEGGFDSGFNPVSADEKANFPGFVYTVTDQKPVWFHCEQLALPAGPPHCRSGMVGAINPPKSGNTFDAFLAKAKGLPSGSNSSPSGTASAPASTSTVNAHCSKTDAIDLPPNQTQLKVPDGEHAAFITMGRGTQNYTCTDGKYVSVGAVAAMYDLSCFTAANDPAFQIIQDFALKLPNPLLNSIDDIESAGRSLAKTASGSDAMFFEDAIRVLTVPDFRLGNHFFGNFTLPDGSVKAEPVFDFRSTQGSDGFIVSNKTGEIPDVRDPTKDVTWLQLSNLQGGLAKTVFRVDTAGGVPPTSCSEEGKKLQVDYAAKYWYFK